MLPLVTFGLGILPVSKLTTQVQKPVLTTGVLGDKHWDNSPIFAGPIQLTYKIKIKNEKKLKVKTLSLYIGLSKFE
jgi:hypothetical protein